VPPPTDGGVLQPPTTISFGQSRTVTLSAGQVAQIAFQGTQGKRASIDLPTVSIDSGVGCKATLRVVAPDGTALMWEPCVLNPATFVEPQLLPATGTYTIVLDPIGTYAGQATMFLYDVPPDPSNNGRGGGVTIAAPGQNARFAFTGTAGETLRLSAPPETVFLHTPYESEPHGLDVSGERRRARGYLPGGQQ